MSENRFTPPPRKKNALDNNKLALSTPSPVGNGKQAKLIWGLVNNNPRITVYTGDESEQGNEKANYGRIVANLDLPTLYTFFEMIENASSKEPGFKVKLENKNFTFFGGKRSDFPVVQTELWCGKDKEGCMWMSVTAKERPMIKFIFGPTDFHHLYNGDGTPMSKAEVSTIFARGYFGLLKKVFSELAVSEFVDLQAEKNAKQGQQGGGFQRGGGGGNFQRGGQGGGNYNNQPPKASYENNSAKADEIPF